MANEYTYPLDFTGTQPSNRIENEKHTVSPPSEISQASFIVARACPFFADTLLVRDGQTATARTLVAGKDYVVRHKSITLSHHAKKDIYASIEFVDRNYTGTVYLSYNTVGGDYTLDDYTILEKLTRERYVLKKTSFDQIVGVPAAFPNPPHQHNPTDLVGMSEMVQKLNELAVAIKGIKGSYGEVSARLESHVNSATAHRPKDVGLANVKNYGIANATDLEQKAPNKYVTAELLRTTLDNQNKYITAVVEQTYPTFEYLGLNHPSKDEVYTKQETDNLYPRKDYLESTFVTKVEQLTESDVASIVNQIVDTSQYHTRTEAYNTFYTRQQIQEQYYTRSQLDANFMTYSEADSRFVQTTNPKAILHSYNDNELVIEDGKFYVGDNAPKEVLKLYIDCINGSDNNPGTKAEPLRTIKRAAEITPQHKSSTWYLKHYTLDQMENANSWYRWDVLVRVRKNAHRKITVYGNTWIDGAKRTEAIQSGGSVNWVYCASCERLPVYIDYFTNSSNQQGIHSLGLYDGGRVDIYGIAFIKPFVQDEKEFIDGGLNSTSWIWGVGECRFFGCYFLQMGEHGNSATTKYSWWASYYHQRLDMTFLRCSYGYVQEAWVNGTKQFVHDFDTEFTYPNSRYRPFEYHYAVGTIVNYPGGWQGSGAAKIGGVQLPTNMAEVLQRPKMFRGLNIVNGVCTNIITQLTLQA